MLGKLEKCRTDLARWIRLSFGSLSKQVQTLERELSALHVVPPTVEVVKQIAGLYEKIHQVRLREEIYWQQQSKIEWLKVGD